MMGPDITSAVSTSIVMNILPGAAGAANRLEKLAGVRVMLSCSQDPSGM